MWHISYWDGPISGICKYKKRICYFHAIKERSPDKYRRYLVYELTKEQVQLTRPIALLHVDCDLYSSTVTILNELKDNIVPGTVIVFDEYINYPGWQLDEFKAWKEHVGAYGREYEYIGRVSKHQKVAIRVTK